MARRTKDWNEGLANDLRNPRFAREFLLAAIDEGISLQHALGKVIQIMGVKEFAAKIDMESPNLLRAISPRHNPTQAIINRLLNPFDLKLSLAPNIGRTSCQIFIGSLYPSLRIPITGDMPASRIYLP
jgi:DNA-binding phage protein